MFVFHRFLLNLSDNSIYCRPFERCHFDNNQMKWGLWLIILPSGERLQSGKDSRWKGGLDRFFVSGQWFSVVMNRIFEMKPEMTGKYTDIIRVSWIFTGDFCLLTKILKSCPCHLSYDSLDMLPARIRWASEREETQRSFFTIWSYRFNRNSLAGFCLDQVAWTYYSWWFMNLLKNTIPHPALLSGRHSMEPSVLYGGQSVL